MKAALDILIDAHLVLLMAVTVWWGLQKLIERSPYRADYTLQLRLMRSIALLVLASPLLAHLFATISEALWPRAPITASDLAVAAFLRGDIAMPAAQFERLLNSRDTALSAILNGDLPWLTPVALAIGTIALLLALNAAISLLHLRGIIARSHVWRRTRTTDIRLSDTTRVPFATRGLRRRHIVLPAALLTDPKARKIVLAHEFEHLRQGDVDWELAFAALRPILFFNPAFHLWQRHFARMRELACDQRVIRRLRLSPYAYANCLLAFCRAPSARALAPAPVSVAFLKAGPKGRAALEGRLLALSARSGPRAGPALAWALFAVLALGIVLAATSVRTPGDWSPDRLMLSTVVNLERLEAINRGY